ncbi:7-carboxy-7-deazaguanine synthase QueE [soil metagenome]
MSESALKVKTTELPLMEAFYTIQGEGYHQGKAAYFIRLGGCDVGCHWCDVKESWDQHKFPVVQVKKIIQEAVVYPSKLAIVTGGEPLMHNLDFLCEELHQNGFHANIETSGAYLLSGQWDWICISPKKFKAPLPEILPMSHELKVVIYNKHDFTWAESFLPFLNSSCKLYLQPEWSKSTEVLPLIIDYIKQNPCWEISLQIHKYLNVP